MTKKSESAAAVQTEQQGNTEGKVVPFVTTDNSREAIDLRVANRMREVKRLNALIDRFQELKEKFDNLKQASDSFNPDNCQIRLFNGSVNLQSSDPQAFVKFCEIQLDAYAEQMALIELELT